jgi:hypothetical protein
MSENCNKNLVRVTKVKLHVYVVRQSAAQFAAVRILFHPWLSNTLLVAQIALWRTSKGGIKLKHKKGKKMREAIKVER